MGEPLRSGEELGRLVRNIATALDKKITNAMDGNNMNAQQAAALEALEWYMEAPAATIAAWIGTTADIWSAEHLDLQWSSAYAYFADLLMHSQRGQHDSVIVGICLDLILLALEARVARRACCALSRTQWKYGDVPGGDDLPQRPVLSAMQPTSRPPSYHIDTSRDGLIEGSQRRLFGYLSRVEDGERRPACQLPFPLIYSDLSSSSIAVLQLLSHEYVHFITYPPEVEYEELRSFSDTADVVEAVLQDRWYRSNGPANDMIPAYEPVTPYAGRAYPPSTPRTPGMPSFANGQRANPDMRASSMMPRTPGTPGSRNRQSLNPAMRASSMMTQPRTPGMASYQRQWPNQPMRASTMPLRTPMPRTPTAVDQRRTAHGPTTPGTRTPVPWNAEQRRRSIRQAMMSQRLMSRRAASQRALSQRAASQKARPEWQMLGGARPRPAQSFYAQGDECQPDDGKQYSSVSHLSEPTPSLEQLGGSMAFGNGTIVQEPVAVKHGKIIVLLHPLVTTDFDAEGIDPAAVVWLRDFLSGYLPARDAESHLARKQSAAAAGAWLRTSTKAKAELEDPEEGPSKPTRSMSAPTLPSNSKQPITEVDDAPPAAAANRRSKSVSFAPVDGGNGKAPSRSLLSLPAYNDYYEDVSKPAATHAYRKPSARPVTAGSYVPTGMHNQLSDLLNKVIRDVHSKTGELDGEQAKKAAELQSMVATLQDVTSKPGPTSDLTLQLGEEVVETYARIMAPTDGAPDDVSSMQVETCSDTAAKVEELHADEVNPFDNPEVIGVNDDAAPAADRLVDAASPAWIEDPKKLATKGADGEA